MVVLDSKKYYCVEFFINDNFKKSYDSIITFIILIYL